MPEGKNALHKIRNYLFVFRSKMFFSVGNPINVELLVLPQSNLNQIAAVLDPMRAANRCCGIPAFEWVISTPDGLPAVTTTGIPIPADKIFTSTQNSAPLFVIASYGIYQNDWKDLTRDLRLYANSGTTIIGIDSGAWLMAFSGLLDGHRATTHWEYLENFESRFSDVQVVDERYVIEDDGRLITVGGAGPTLDLMLHIIRDRFGSSSAHEVANMFIYDNPKTGLASQRGLTIDPPGLIDARVANSIAMMETHIEDTLTIEQIASQQMITQRQLLTLFLKETGMTTKQYYTELRLHHAKRLLIETKMNIAEIATRCGYSSSSRFGLNFARAYNKTPGQMRRESLS